MTVTDPLPISVAMPDLAPSPLESLEQIIAGASDLAALPQVVLRVLDLTSDSKTTPADLEKIIGLDQALAAKILALANSSYYGMPHQISSLREAAVFLGNKSIRHAAETITNFNQFLGRGDMPALARRALWRHSVDTAQCARVITGLLNRAAQEAVGADQAYTAGLLHDIGKMALDRSRHALFVSITHLSQAQHVRFHEIEEEAMPFGHAQIGGALASRWDLPPALCEAITFHHTPRAASLNPKLTATISLANEMAHCLEDAAEEGKDAARTHLLEACREAAIPLRVSEECLQAMARACRAELNKGLSGLAF